MKLSQLILREKIYNIISKTINTNSFFKDNIDEKNIVFNCFKYLNIILNKSLSDNVKDTLVFEYSLSKSAFKQFLQNIYITIIFLPIIRNFLSDKRIMLPSYLKNYGVVPGNHRIRLFGSSLKEIIVLLKNNESSKFIKNDIDARVNNSLSYTPKILSYGSDWLIEEFINGVPFNRVKNINSDKALKDLISLHTKELINKNKKNISIDTYLNKCKEELYLLVEIIEENNPIKKEIISGLENLHTTIVSQNIIEIETSTTHGDFQEGNIRINSNNELYVLDWESAANRFYLYDVFVMLSSVRTGIGLDKAFELFFQKVDEYQIKINRYSKTSIILLLCFEELRFHFSEDISYNFFSSGVNSKITLNKISTFLDSVKII
ncbi:phosphotransferase [Flavobacteriaceae bacterium]|nr:phosphotransferase [Flavobacteriaceae bacterium]